MAKKLTSGERGRIAWAIERVATVANTTLPASGWVEFRDCAILLRGSLNGRSPTAGENRLLALGERIESWHPLPADPIETPFDQELPISAAKVRELEERLESARGELQRLEPSGSFGSPASGRIEEGREAVQDASVACQRAIVARHKLLDVRQDWVLHEWLGGRITRPQYSATCAVRD